jgi:hypothetical protein
VAVGDVPRLRDAAEGDEGGSVNQRDDLKMLDKLLGKELWEKDSITTAEVEAFASMRFNLRAYQTNTIHQPFEFLTTKERAQLTAVYECVMSSESRFSKPPGSTTIAQANRKQDLLWLNRLCDAVEGDHEAFLSMREGLDKFVCLTPTQRSWVRSSYEAGVASGAILPPLENPVPVGKPVVSMVGVLPKKPPPLPREPERPKRMTAEHRPFKVTGLDEPGGDDD